MSALGATHCIWLYLVPTGTGLHTEGAAAPLWVRLGSRLDFHYDLCSHQEGLFLPTETPVIRGDGQPSAHFWVCSLTKSICPFTHAFDMFAGIAAQNSDSTEAQILISLITLDRASHLEKFIRKQ